MQSPGFIFLAITLMALVIYVEREPLPARASVLPLDLGVIRPGASENRMPSTTLPRGGTRAAYIMDNGGTPVPGVQVIIEADGGERRVTSDPSGRFEVDESIEASATVWFRADGYIPCSAPMHRVIRHREVTLQPGGAIAGTVVDQNQHPITEAEVHARSASGWSDRLLTDADGHFVVWAPPGELYLSVHSSLQGDRESIEYEVLEGQCRQVTISLPPGIELEVRIVDERQVPVPNARISLHSSSGDRELTITNRDGEATIKGITGASARIAITHGGHAEVIEAFEIHAVTGTDRREFVLRPAAPWSCQVLGRDLAPAVAAEITVLRRGIELTRARAVDSHALQVLARDRCYDLVIQAPGHQTLRARKERLPEHPTFLLAGGRRISGRVVTDHHHGMSGVSVRVARCIGDDDQVPVATILTDATGCFETDYLPPGSYSIQGQLGTRQVDQAVVLEDDDVTIPAMILH